MAIWTAASELGQLAGVGFLESGAETSPDRRIRPTRRQWTEPAGLQFRAGAIQRPFALLAVVWLAIGDESGPVALGRGGRGSLRRRVVLPYAEDVGAGDLVTLVAECE